jgi:hypothetical protein
MFAHNRSLALHRVVLSFKTLPFIDRATGNDDTPRAMATCEMSLMRCSAAILFLVVALCLYMRTMDVTGVYELLLGLHNTAIVRPGESGQQAIRRLLQALRHVNGWTNRCANAETPLVLMNLVGVTVAGTGGARPAVCRIRGCGRPPAGDARRGLSFTTCDAHLPEPVRLLVEHGRETTRYEAHEERI